MKRKLLLCSLCVCLLLVTGCGNKAKLQDGKEVVAEIDGKTITAEELYDRMRQQTGTTVMVNMIDDFIANKEHKTDKTAENYATSQIETLKLQYEQAEKDFNVALVNAGYKDEAAFRDALILDYKKNLVVKDYVRSTLTEEEIKKYYEEEITGEITVRHILIKPDVTDSMSSDEKTAKEEEALAKAKELIKKLDEGADFETLAKENSDDSSASEGGLIADFTKKDVVSEFWDASSKLEKDKYTTTPVKSQYGYHIILKVSSKEKPTQEDVIEDIKDELVSQKLTDDEQLSMKAWAEVRKNYKLNIVDSELKSNYETTINSLK